MTFGQNWKSFIIATQSAIALTAGAGVLADCCNCDFDLT